MGDDPPYLMVGTEVSAKYKGAFCEAKIRKVVRVVKCRVTFKTAGLGSLTIPDDHVKGDLRVGAVVEAKHPDRNQFVEATINKIQDSSQYTVVFDDGDITTLRRSALCLKSGRHFNESETLDQLPLTHPEHFSNPVVGGRRGVRRRAINNDDNENESSDDEDVPAKRGRKKPNKEADMGQVVCVESNDKKKNSKDSWFPALIVCPSAQDTVKIRTKDEYLVRSFRDGRYYTVPKKETTKFPGDSLSKAEHGSNLLRAACDKAMQYLGKDELPPHWDREVLFGQGNTGDVSDEALSDSGTSDEDPAHEDKDRFVAQLYKFMDDRRTPIGKVPAIGGKDLDLYKLYQVVKTMGGYNKVCNAGQWKAVTVKMGYGTSPAMVTVNFLKQSYKKLLHNFEDFYKKLGPLDSLNALSSSGSKSRSNRSLIRDRSTKEVKKEEPKDEEDKKSVKSVGSTQGASSSIAGESPEEMDAETESVYSEKLDTERQEEQPRRSRSRLDSRGKKDSEEIQEKKGRRGSKKKELLEREKERESSRTPVSASPSPAPLTKRTGVGRARKKKEAEAEGEKSEHEDFPDHIDKTVKIRVGDKVQVYYGPKSKGNVTYKAKVIDVDEAGAVHKYLVHYTGWNTRYDEWIERYRIGSLQTGKEANEDASEADSNGATSSGKGPPPQKVVKKKGRPAGQGKKAGIAKKNPAIESTEKPKRRRMRKKSDSIAPSGSGSDADSSDSEDKQIPTVSTPSSASSTASSPGLRGNKSQKAEPQDEEDDDNSSSSSSASNASKKTDGKAAPISTESAIDLVQIRSEMKGLDKLVKMCQPTGGSPSPLTIPRSSSPVPAASVCVPQTELKLDVYEFQDDANDTPKLKIFAPMRSPERKEEHGVSKGHLESDPGSSPPIPVTPSKAAGQQRSEETLKKERKKKTMIEKEEESPVYSPIKIPKPLLAAKESRLSTPGSSTAIGSPRASVPSLQPSFPVEVKSNFRMQTPQVHTPTQPVRQRAVVSSYPPPLIPSGNSKSSPALGPIVVASPPMPSLTQRPSVVTTAAAASNPTPHQARPTTPLNLPTAPLVSVPSSLPPAPILQPAASHKPQVDPKKPPFVCRQQEIFPNLAQQAAKAVPIINLPLKSSAASSSISASSGNVPINTVISGLPQTGLLTTTAEHDFAMLGKEIPRPPAVTITPSLGASPFVPSSLPKKSPVKRKQISKEKIPKSPPGLLVPNVGSSAARMDQSHLPPKKKAKKVITKNLIHGSKSDSDQQPAIKEETTAVVDSPTKKARKPAKKRIPPPEVFGDEVGLQTPEKSQGKSPARSGKKKPKAMDLSPGPPMLGAAKIPKPIPFVGYNQQQPTPVPAGSSSGPSFSLGPVSLVQMEMKPVTAYTRPEVHIGAPQGMERVPVAKPVATLGNFSVMKAPEKKSYAPPRAVMSSSPRMPSFEGIGKLPEQICNPVATIPGTVIPSSIPVKTTVAPGTATTTTYVKIPNRFDPSPVVIATVTAPPSATPQQPITVIPMRSFASTANPVTRHTVEDPSIITGPLVFTSEARTDSAIKPVLVVPLPKSSPPISAAPTSVPVIKIPETRDHHGGGWREDKDDAPVCLVVKEAKANVSIKEEQELDREDDVKPTDLSLSVTSSTTLELSGDADVVKEEKGTKEEDESCNSLLCEEEIPGSPPPGADSSFFGMEEDNALPGVPVKEDESPELKTKFDSNFSLDSSSNKEGKSDRVGRSKSPKSGPSSSEASGTKKADESVDKALPGDNNNGNNRDRPVAMAYNNNNNNNNHHHHQQNLQHVMDNTPPTTPESSSISSGSPRVDGGRVSPINDNPSSSKSKDSSDLDSNDKMAEMNEEGSSSDAGRKYVKEVSSPQKKRHTDPGRNSGNVSPPAKRRRVQRRKSPDDLRSYGYRGRGSGSGRKGNEKDIDHGKIQPPPPPVNLTRPPTSKKFNLIPDMDEAMDSESRIAVLQQALQSIKEKYKEVKEELSGEERRLKRFKRRLKDREREKAKVVKSV